MSKESWKEQQVGSEYTGNNVLQTTHWHNIRRVCRAKRLVEFCSHNAVTNVREEGKSLKVFWLWMVEYINLCNSREFKFNNAMFYALFLWYHIHVPWETGKWLWKKSIMVPIQIDCNNDLHILNSDKPQYDTSPITNCFHVLSCFRVRLKTYAYHNLMVILSGILKERSDMLNAVWVFDINNIYYFLCWSCLLCPLGTLSRLCLQSCYQQ